MIAYVYSLVYLDNIFHDRICYTKNWGLWEFSKFYQRNSKLPLPRWKRVIIWQFPSMCFSRLCPVLVIFLVVHGWTMFIHTNAYYHVLHENPRGTHTVPGLHRGVQIFEQVFRCPSISPTNTNCNLGINHECYSVSLPIKNKGEKKS